MIGVIVNVVAVIIGSLIGLLFKKGIPKTLSDVVMIAIGLCTLVIGIQGSIATDNPLILIISMVLGTIVGSLIDLDKRLHNLGKLAENLVPSNPQNGSVAYAFVAASLLMCVGAMSVVGSLNAGLVGDNSILFTKSLMDFISSIFMTLSLGVGVALASITVLVLQGSVVLLAQVIAPILTDSMVLAMSSVGSVIILALGLNLIGLSKFKIANFLPAILFAPFVALLFTLF